VNENILGVKDKATRIFISAVCFLLSFVPVISLAADISGKAREWMKKFEMRKRK